jgi:hypothetical protein
MDSSAERAAYLTRFPRRAPRARRLPDSAAEQWMEVPEAARALQVGLNTVRRRAAAGVLASTEKFGRLVVSRRDVEKLAAAIAAGAAPRDLRRLRGEDRPPNTWNGRFPVDRYVESREGAAG